MRELSCEESLKDYGDGEWVKPHNLFDRGKRKDSGFLRCGVKKSNLRII